MDAQFRSDPAMFRNEILAALPATELERLRPLLTRTAWITGQTLMEPGRAIEHVFFPEQGVVSMVAEAELSGGRIEVGMVGRETMLGLLAMLGPEAQPFNRALVQVPGSAHRMGAHALRENIGTMPALRRLIGHAVQAAVAQVSQTAVCNVRHTLPQRLARWLLAVHDRVDGDELPLTQEFLSLMLAVRRPGITTAVGALQATGLIRNGRGRIVICDRIGLETATCSCYGIVKSFTASLAGKN